MARRPARGMDGVRAGPEPTDLQRYERPAGDVVSRSVSDVAWHLINHGTFHRGQLREIADQAGMEWSETDVTLWRTPLP